MKTCFHVDMDAFFVSVEELFDPSLKGKAVVVGGQRDERGVVSAASYEARKFGVHSAMPLRTAAKHCPHALFINGHPDRYRDYSRRVFEVLNRFSPLVEMASVDEAFMDMTGTERLLGPPLRAAHTLHDTMKREIGLNCSVGIAASRLVAKVASDQAKPNGILWVIPGCEEAFLAPLEIRKIPGIGKVSEKNLHARGFRIVADLVRIDDPVLAGKARGLDVGGWFDEEIGAGSGPKSVSHEHTYGEDTADAETLEATLARLSEMVGRRLREYGLYARTIQLKLRYSDFSTITRAHSFDDPTQLDIDLFEQARKLFRGNWRAGASVRLLGVQTSRFDPERGQLDLLDGGRHERWMQALSAADRLRDKYGEAAVSIATGMKGRFRERVHENPTGLPGKLNR